MIAKQNLPARIVAIGDRGLLQGAPHIEHVPLARPRTPGKLDPANGRYVLSVLDRAIRGCLAGEFDAMVTAPVQKSVINDAGVPFTGHTEYLAEKTNTPHVVMMLVGGGLRVALAIPEARPWATLQCAEVLHLHDPLAAVAHELEPPFQIEHLDAIAATGQHATQQVGIAHEIGARRAQLAVHRFDRGLRGHGIASARARATLQM